jgi:hypothetical protein
MGIYTVLSIFFLFLVQRTISDGPELASSAHISAQVSAAPTGDLK